VALEASRLRPAIKEQELRWCGPTIYKALLKVNKYGRKKPWLAGSEIMHERRKEHPLNNSPQKQSCCSQEFDCSSFEWQFSTTN
jgi:hypothetical protein